MNVVPLNVAMTVNSPRIPLEIVEFVIDVLNVDDEIDAIKACSQTCKVFFPAVGNTFFSRIDLDLRLNSRHISPNHDSDDAPPRRMRLFLDLLDQTPDITFYVQDLDLYIYLEDSDRPRTIRALNMLSNLTAFSLRHDFSGLGDFNTLNWGDLCPNFITCIHHIISSPKLTQLEFASFTNFPLSTFSWCGGGLEELSLKSVELSTNGSTFPVMTPLRLRALSCDEAGVILVGQILLIKSEYPIMDLTLVHRFIASLHEAGGNICMREILSSSEVLTEVHLLGTTSHTYRGVGQSIASSLNTLQTFQLSIFTSSLIHNIIPEICTELKVLAAAPNLHHVVIRLSLDILYRFRAGVLLALDNLLTGPGFRRFQSVGFHVNGSASLELGDAHEFKEAMEQVILEEFISLPRSGVRTVDTSVTLQSF